MSAILNQLIIGREVYRIMKDDRLTNIRGAIFLCTWGALLGPVFTALCLAIYILERYE